MGILPDSGFAHTGSPSPHARAATAEVTRMEAARAARSAFRPLTRRVPWPWPHTPRLWSTASVSTSSTTHPPPLRPSVRSRIMRKVVPPKGLAAAGFRGRGVRAVECVAPSVCGRVRSSGARARARTRGSNFEMSHPIDRSGRGGAPAGSRADVCRRRRIPLSGRVRVTTRL